MLAALLAAIGIYLLTDAIVKNNDQVVTTGSTLSECCRVLKGAGAARVDCAAFASPRNENER